MVSKAMVSETINTKTAKGIEGNNCIIRHRVRRAFRRSCNFPKKLENHFKAFDLAFFGVSTENGPYRVVSTFVIGKTHHWNN